LRDRGRQNQQRDHKILRRFRLLPAEDQKSQAASEHRKDQELGRRSVFQPARQFASRPAPPGLS